MDTELTATPLANVEAKTFPEPVIRHVSDTAWLVAAMRVIESERSDALFKDPLAIRLLGEKGQGLIDLIKKRAEDYSWFIAVRTIVIDRWVGEIIQSQSVDAVVNLAAGLCTRPYRLKLPSQLHWIDVDFAPVIEHRRRCLVGQMPTCQMDSVAVDLSIDADRRDFLQKISGQYKHILVITEGLLPYLNTSVVEHLADDLHAQASVQFWLTDMYGASAWSGEHQSEWQKALQVTDAKLEFLFSHSAQDLVDRGWELINSENFVKVGEVLQRLPSHARVERRDSIERWRDCHIYLFRRGASKLS